MEPGIAETAAAIQARIDACPKGLAVEVRGVVKLERPLLLPEGVSLVGAPKGVLQTAGPFPAVIAGPPPPRRWPGWPGRQRVDIAGATDGSLTIGLDLSEAVLRLAGSAFELAGGEDALTISALLIRKGESWGNNNTAPILSTDPDRAAADPIRLLLQGTRLMLWFRTQDGITRVATWNRPVDWPTARIVVVLDLAGGRLGAYLDGAYAPADLSGIGPGWGPGLRMAAGEFTETIAGRDPNNGQGAYVLGGLRVSRKLAAPVGVAAGTTLPGTDAALFGPSKSGTETSLDLAAPPMGADDPLVWHVRGAKRGCTLLTPAKWGVYDTVGEAEIRDLTIQVGDFDHGVGLEIGICRNLRLERLIVTRGAKGILQHHGAVSYPLWLSAIRFSESRQVALTLGRGIVYADALNFDRGPRRAQLQINGVGGLIERFFMAEQPCPAPIVVKNYTGQLTLRDGIINHEGEGPDAYIVVRRDQTGPGVVAQLIVDHVEVGNAAPEVAVVDLQDPYWKGRTGTIGSGLLTVRDSFTIVRPCAVASPGSGAWAVEVSGPVAAALPHSNESRIFSDPMHQNAADAV
jgi:hypothetical protein